MVGPELARTYLRARGWYWALLELDGGDWLATRQDGTSDTRIERRSPTLDGALKAIDEYERTRDVVR